MLEWVARHNVPAGYVPVINDAVTDSFGNTYITGYIWIHDQFDTRDCITLKFNSSGELVWSRTYNGLPNLADESNALCVDKKGNCYIAGFSVLSGYLIIKYNINGDSVWVRTYNSSNGPNQARDIAIDYQGNIYVTGHSYQSTFPDFTTIKYDSLGNQLWIVFYNGLSDRNDFARQITLDKNNDVIISGNSQRSGSINDVVTIKYNSSGDSIWNKMYSGVNNQGAGGPNNLLTDDSSNIYFYCNGSRIIKYNSSGDSLLIFGVSDSIQSMSFCLDSTHNFYIASTVPGMNIRTDCITIKYNSTGTLLWQQKYAGSLFLSDDAGRDVAIDKYGNVYAAGYMDSGRIAYDYLTIKYDNDGNFLWKARYGFGSSFIDDKAYFIGLDTAINIYITGLSGGAISTIKYSQPPVGVINLGGEVPKEFKLFQNYPNPFNPITNVKFRIPNESFAKLTLYDVLGREIAILVNEQLKPGTYEIQWDGTNYPSVAYFYRIEAGDYIESKKMVLIK
ncbi:MAG: SBBP repeat-containing protein [Chlorobi bacterium]|nr:SBBP repeat-containing protein [Chlorobiota bacterium]